MLVVEQCQLYLVETCDIQVKRVYIGEFARIMQFIWSIILFLAAVSQVVMCQTCNYSACAGCVNDPECSWCASSETQGGNLMSFAPKKREKVSFSHFSGFFRCAVCQPNSASCSYPSSITSGIFSISCPSTYQAQDIGPSDSACSTRRCSHRYVRSSYYGNCDPGISGPCFISCRGRGLYLDMCLLVLQTCQWLLEQTLRVRLT